MVESCRDLDAVVLVLLWLVAGLVRSVHVDLLGLLASVHRRLADAQLTVLILPERKDSLVLRNGQGMEGTTGYRDDLLLVEALDLLWRDLPRVSTMTKSPEASVAPREQLVLLSNRCGVALACRYKDGLPLRERVDLPRLQFVLQLLVVVAQPTMASLAPREDVVGTRQAHGVALAAGNLHHLVQLLLVIVEVEPPR